MVSRPTEQPDDLGRNVRSNMSGDVPRLGRTQGYDVFLGHGWRV